MVDITEKHNKIRDLLLGTDTDNRLKSKDIAAAIGIEAGPSSVTIRNLIRETIFHFKIPICGGSNGYYLISNHEELKICVGSLESRKLEIDRRKTKLWDSFIHYYGEDAIDDEDIDEDDYI